MIINKTSGIMQEASEILKLFSEFKGYVKKDRIKPEIENFINLVNNEGKYVYIEDIMD